MCYKLYNSGYQFKYFPILISYFDRSGISSTDPYKGLKESAELTDTKYTLAFLLFYCFNMLRIRLALRNKLKKIGLIKISNDEIKFYITFLSLKAGWWL